MVIGRAGPNLPRRCFAAASAGPPHFSRDFLPRDRPVLILMDELMNFVNRSRKSGLAGQLYSFLHSLSEEARGRDNMVLAVSIPVSELEMSAEDQSDYERFKMEPPRRAGCLRPSTADSCAKWSSHRRSAHPVTGRGRAVI